MKIAIICMFIFCSMIISGCSNQKSDFLPAKYEENGVVFYLADQEKRENEPVIILCHGLGGSHQDMAAAAELFYKQGYATVTLDLYGHDDIIYSSDIYIDEIIQKSADKIYGILQFLKNERLCESEAYGIYGYSVGGMIGFYLSAYGDTPPKILISMASLPDFEGIFANACTIVPLKFCIETSQFEMTNTEENSRLTEWMSSNNPIDHLEQMQSTAIYMVNGGKDSIMPPEIAIQFQENFSSVGGFLQLYINPDGTHNNLGDYHVESILKSARTILLPFEQN